MEELYVDSVAHRYGSYQVLSSVYLSCKVGEVVGLLGRNGSGKSTLLKIIFGSIKPHYMHLKVNERLTKKAYRTGQVAYLPQGFFIPTNLTVRQTVELYTYKFKADLLAEVLISANLDTTIGNLSAGQRRLVECLAILYSDATFVLLDEPFSQLAPLIIEEIQRHIIKLKAYKGIVFTDHMYQQILSASSRVVLLHNGCNYQITCADDLVLHGYVHHLFP